MYENQGDELLQEMMWMMRGYVGPRLSGCMRGSSKRDT